MPEDLQTTWERIRGELRGDVSDSTFHLWLDPLALAERSGETLYVRAPRHVRTWVNERYLPQLRAAGARALGRPVVVEVVGEEWEPAPVAPGRAVEPGSEGAERLNLKYTFAQFVIGDGNRLAHAAALAVAEMPAQAYNPLFLHGPPGLGKTHLLHAVGNYIQAHGLGLSVRYATVEAFTNEFLRSLREDGKEAFKRRFRETDVLLVDDVQFLAHKARTKEEFFHCFNALYESGRQLVLTSDRPPHEMDGFEDRLAERFGAGLVAEVEAPSFPVRLAILRTRARMDALGEIPDEVLAEIAGRVEGSVRTLEGALIRVVAYASLRAEEPTAAMAENVLAQLYPSAQPRSTLAAIRAEAAREFGVEEGELLAHDRRPRVTLARQVAMYLARELSGESLPAIGLHFGGRNHSTVLHAHRRIADVIGRQPSLRTDVERLRQRLVGSSGDRRG